MGADLAASGDGEAAQEKVKDGQELAVRTMQRGPEVAQLHFGCALDEGGRGLAAEAQHRGTGQGQELGNESRRASRSGRQGIAPHWSAVLRRRQLFVDPAQGDNSTRRTGVVGNVPGGRTSLAQVSRSRRHSLVNDALLGDMCVHIGRNDEAKKWHHHMLDRTVVTAKKHQVHDVVKMKHNDASCFILCSGNRVVLVHGLLTMGHSTRRAGGSLRFVDCRRFGKSAIFACFLFWL